MITSIPPCRKCLVRITCRTRIIQGLYNSVIDFANNENCPYATKFIEYATQEDINEMRILFGMKPYK